MYGNLELLGTLVFLSQLSQLPIYLPILGNAEGSGTVISTVALRGSGAGVFFSANEEIGLSVGQTKDTATEYSNAYNAYNAVRASPSAHRLRTDGTRGFVRRRSDVEAKRELARRARMQQVGALPPCAEHAFADRSIDGRLAS